MKSVWLLFLTLAFSTAVLSAVFFARRTPPQESEPKATIAASAVVPIEDPVVTIHEPLVPVDPVDDETNQLSGSDTAFFIYSVGQNGANAGMQSHGSRHKVGVKNTVANAYPVLVSELPSLANYNNDRDQCLLNAGQTPRLQYRYWRVLVENATLNPDQSITLNVSAGVGADRCGMCTDGGVDEVWLFTGGQFQLQSRTFLHGFRAVGIYSLQGELTGM